MQFTHKFIHTRRPLFVWKPGASRSAGEESVGPYLGPGDMSLLGEYSIGEEFP